MSTVRSNWLEQALPDGRKYWYNMNNGESVWEEPAELSANTALPKRPVVPSSGSSASDIVASWRELTAANGRKYYYNAVTKVSLWEIPPEYAAHLERLKDPASMDREVLESKFLNMLKEAGITSKHSWEEALRTVYNHPHYKLVPTLAERKALFARHIQVQREIEREERHQKGLRDREEFKKLLQETPSITSATRYSEVLDLLGENAIWLAVDSPKERSVLFDEHVAQLRRQEAEQKRERRRRCQEKYNKLLTVSLESEIKYDTLWKTALPLIQSSYDFRQDADLQSMDLADLLIGFETHIKNLERVEHRREAVVKTEERRKERMARRDFKLLLDELEAKGALTPVTSWSEIYPTIKDRGELDAIISQQGSTPLDLFWDRLHKLQEGYINEAQRIIDALRTQLGDHWIEKTDEATIASFVDKDNNHLVEHVCKHLLKRKNKDAMSGELTSEERQRLTSKVDQWRRDRRKLIDKLKHCIKHFDPPIRIDSTFAQYAPLLAAHPDGAAIADEQIIHYYFDKYLRHLKKKASGEKSEGDD